MSQIHEVHRERLKTEKGALAAIVWIGTGIYLFATTAGAHFFSWQAAIFFVAGMFAAAIVFGAISHAVLMRLMSFNAHTKFDQHGRKAVFMVLATVYWIGELALIIAVANWAFHNLLGL